MYTIQEIHIKILIVTDITDYSLRGFVHCIPLEVFVNRRKGSQDGLVDVVMKYSPPLPRDMFIAKEQMKIYLQEESRYEVTNPEVMRNILEKFRLKGETFRF